MTLSEVKTLLEKVLAFLPVSVERVEVVDTDAQAFIIVHTPDSGKLIGSGGESLRALNHVLKKMVEAGVPDGAEAPSFTIDINGYYQKKLAELRMAAKILADRARMFKHDVEMVPMSSYERMLVHAMFTNDPSITTESVGEGKFRHVVLRYREPLAPESVLNEPV